MLWVYLWPLEIFYFHSAGIGFRRQNLTFIDGRQILTSKVGRRAVRITIFLVL